ncbi:MAG: hypothetical protein MI723_01135 [Caulobacterales bacterium]|nr:hypothetical protein [Caulobacterales bacterium]
MCAVLAGCAEGSLTSAYLNPEEGVLYRYGNFCGAGHPTRISEDPNVQLPHLRAIQPVDSIDFVCKMHDICFEERGRDDPGCDYAIIGALGYTISSTFASGQAAESGTRMKCVNLATEIMTPFSTKYVSNAPAGSMSATADNEANATQEGLAASMIAGAFTGLSGLIAGFPDQPGTCTAAGFDALQNNFVCHANFFQQQLYLYNNDYNAVRLSEMDTNGCKATTENMFGAGG